MTKKRRSPSKPPPKILPPKPPLKLPPLPSSKASASSLPADPASTAAPAASVTKESPPLVDNPLLHGASIPAADSFSASGNAAPSSKQAPSGLPLSEPESKTQLLDSASSSRDETAHATSKPLWIDLLKGPSGTMSKKGEAFRLESGELCVKIPNEVITRNHEKWKSFIIGQFHGNIPPPGALHAIFNGIWSNRLRDITISKLGTRTVLIRIPNSITRQRVLNQGMWHIEGQTMFVAPWEPGLNPSLPELTEAPVWLEFRGVPPHFFSEEGFEHIAGMLGQPVHCHPSTINMTNLEVGRVLTIINPLLPLPEAVNVQFATGEIHRVAVSCPWLPPICSHCQEIGHSIKRCPTAPITCITCNSSAHPLETCPRSRKVKETNNVEGKSSSVKKDKKARTKASPFASGPKWVEKQSIPESSSPGSSGGLKKVEKLKSKLVADKSLKSIVETGSHSKTAARRSSVSKKEIFASPKSKKKKNSQHVSSSSSSDSRSSEDSQCYSSTEISSSEEEISEEEEDPFIKVLSKKEKRFLRNSSGKSPTSKNH